MKKLKMQKNLTMHDAQPANSKHTKLVQQAIHAIMQCMQNIKQNSQKKKKMQNKMRKKTTD